MLTRRNIKGGIVVEIIVIVLALGLLGKAISAGFSTYTFVHLAQIVTIEATVKDVHDHGFTVALQFVLPSGEKIDFSQAVLIPKYVNDQHVLVAYDPNQPSNARLESFPALWFHSIVFGVPGFLLLMLGLKLHGERSI